MLLPWRPFHSLIYFSLFVSDIVHSLSTVPVPRQLQELQECYTELQEGRQSRNLLQRRHAAEFRDESVFRTFARTVCMANAVPRKELFETWAVALCVQQEFADCRRIADLACGHGLLAWALLVLDLNLNNNDNDNSPRKTTWRRRTAVCIDKRMPLSAEKVAEAMLDQYPELKGCWDFVEGKLDAVTISNHNQNQNTGSYYEGEAVGKQTTLLCGVHACGILSDQILSLAIQGNAPVVLLPCCHSKKSLEKQARNEYEYSKHQEDACLDLAEFVDKRRVQRLEKAGYIVERSSSIIPEQFTPQNALIMASPTTESQLWLFSTENTIVAQSKLPRLESTIPVDDNEESRTVIRSMAGRAAAISRKQPSPVLDLCVSISMPQDKTLHVSPHDLALLADRILHDQQTMASSSLSSTTATAESTSKGACKSHVDYADSEAFFHAQSGRYFRTFRISYSLDGNQSNTYQRDASKELQAQLCQKIPEAFSGCTVRS